MKIAIACGSGGYRTVFIHGVLSAFEDAKFRADAYGGTSASVLATAFAAIGNANSSGVEYWIRALDIKRNSEIGMSEVSKVTAAETTPTLVPQLFAEGAPRLVVPVSAVTTTDGAATTQSNEARRLGRKLLLLAARRKPSDWVAENLTLHLYDTHGGDHPLTPENFADVSYASSRMMHAWDIPATINGQPYVDASYLCSIPAVELAETGNYDAVIAISADPPGTIYRDIFGTRPLPEKVGDTPIHRIMPQVDPTAMGADFTDATPEGLAKTYTHGKTIAQQFLESW